MKRRADRNRQFQAMEDKLFNAGVSILQAAKTQEEMFTTSVNAIQAALETANSEETQLETPTLDAYLDPPVLPQSLHTLLLAQLQAAQDCEDTESQFAIMERLARLEVLEHEREQRSIEKASWDVQKLELQVRRAKAIRQLQRLSDPPIAATPPTLSTHPSVHHAADAHGPAQPPIQPPTWTEQSLRKEFKSLAAIRKQFGIEAKSWKEAAQQANSLSS